MTGFVGAFGDRMAGLDAFPSMQRGEEERTESFADEEVMVSTGFHSGLADEQPVETVVNDTLVWVLGEVYGFERNSTYQPRPESIDTPSYCANLYESYGIDFVQGLNGDFAGIIYDREERTVFLLTNRLGSYPVFYTRMDGTLLCSTDIQALPRFPGIEPEFDRDYLAEFLAFKRSFGVTTPLSGIKRLPPATVTAIDLNGLSTESWRYWWPEFTPKDEPFEHFVEEFIGRFQRVLSEWLRDDQKYGLLLSGGSDSRLIMAAVDHPIVGFHMNDWRNREARVAKRVATATGNEFRLLHRDKEYRRRSLAENPSLSNFDGWYKQGYPTAFANEITGSVDALMSGLYADILFKGHSIPSPKVSLGSLGKVTLPFETPIRTVDEFIERQAADAPDYLVGDVDLEAILRENIFVTADGEIDHHGVRYPSIRELVLCSNYYPLSNDTELIYTNSLRQLRPSRSPFLDNRLIDLHLSMPVKYQLRRNIIHRAIERLDSRLAKIPHSESGVPMNRSFPVEYFVKHLNAFRWKHFEVDTPPKLWCTHGPWPNDEKFVRESGFVQDALAENRAVVESHPLLDWDGVRRSYHDHLNGEDNTVELYTLLTLLEMPLTKQLCEATETDDSQDSIAPPMQSSDRLLVKPSDDRGGGDH